MKRSKLGLSAVAFTMLSAGIAGSAFGQEQPRPGGNPPGGQGGDRNRFDPAAMRQRYMDSIKERLGASDDEWKVLQPRVEKVMDASRATRSDSGRFGGGRGGRPGGDGNNGGSTATTTPPTPVAAAATALRTVAENKASTPEECAAKLAAYREARDKARAELAAAQKELKDLLTPKQEAILVSAGTLD